MLKEIISYKKNELKVIKSHVPISEIKNMIRDAEPIRDFSAAIARTEEKSKQINIIGEIKKASPSVGVIRKDFDPVAIAKAYEKNGISAISVLTDMTFFQGDNAYISQVKDAVKLPLLRKDFIFDEYQICESAAIGADAILLIAAVLDRNQLIEYILCAKDLGLHTLVEIHNTKDMEKAFYEEKYVNVVGINNRDLKTFKVDVSTTVKLIKEFPEGKITVSESGIKTTDHITRLTDAGVHAFLIGETFMRQDDIGKKVSEFVRK